MPMRRDELGRQSTHQGVIFGGFAKPHGEPSDFPLLTAPDFGAQRCREQLTAETDAKDWLVGLERAFNQHHFVAQIWISIELIDRLRTAQHDQTAEALDVFGYR